MAEVGFGFFNPRDLEISHTDAGIIIPPSGALRAGPARSRYDRYLPPLLRNSQYRERATRFQVNTAKVLMPSKHLMNRDFRRGLPNPRWMI
jgi:hypothetical protein